MTDAEVALSLLAQRVLNLENAAGGSVVVGDGGCVNGAAAVSVLARTLVDLKRLRGQLVTAAREVESRALEAERAEAENDKLRYQIRHLRRSLEAEENGK
jgi:molybdenum-dependent DNA-binding transcriptional regulator ModE